MLSARAVVALAFLAVPAAAQTTCGQPGVDLVVELGSVQNYAVAAGVDALSIAFEPSNLGSAPASWSTTSSAHPVVVLGLFRYSVDGAASRFEQIGMSWARHASVPPLQQGGPCACAPAGANELGPGCRDVLSAAGNGLAANLGPRHAIDPLTGAFAFPHATPAAGPHAGRLQFAPGDVTVGDGERYVLEAVIVSADDAARANDATWVELAPSVLAGEVAFALAGPTHVGATALDAWKAFDPAVELSDVVVPNEGSFQLAARVAEVAPGTWRYAYALYDRDVARGASALRIPIPIGPFPTNAAFRGVAYHDGDGAGGVDQSAAPWTATFTGTELVFACVPFALDANANALRFATAYAFEIECAAPPMPGSVAIDLFEPGVAAGASATTHVPLDLAALAIGFCFGDGLGTPCPCANHSPQGHGEGCTSSIGTGGYLRADGWPSLARDTLTLVATQMPSSTTLFVQSTGEEAGGFGSPSGDGLLCLAGTLIRLGTRPNAIGASSYPGPGQAALSVRGAAVAGTTYAYQAWYRNAAAFCTSSTYNTTNGVRATWVP